MTSDLAHATAVRALNETQEDYPNASDEDRRVVFSGRLAALLGMPVDSCILPKSLPHRMTPRTVRKLVYDVADKMLPAQTVVALMNELDNAMALNAVPVMKP